MLEEKTSFFVGLLTGTLAFFSYRLYKIRCRNTWRALARNKNSYTRVLFFPDKVIACKAFYVNDYGCTTFECHFSHNEEETSLGKLFTLLGSVRRSIYVCVYTLTCNDLVDILIRLNQMAAEVKVITDSEFENINNSLIWKLRSCGIQVRTDSLPYFMHHKFAIIDEKIILTGSFNWTIKAVTGNQEDIFITNKPHVVQQYIKEFKELWHYFDPKLSHSQTMSGRYVQHSIKKDKTLFQPKKKLISEPVIF